MARNSRFVPDATIDDVFDVLRDGSLYASWVVGTRKIRRVEPGWPEPGTSIHYTAGHWPLRKDDRTTSRGYVPDARLELAAHAWPTGTIGIVITAEVRDGGVEVTIDESPARGVLKVLNNPAIELGIKLRNVETLRRFEHQVRRKQAERAASA